MECIRRIIALVPLSLALFAGPALAQTTGRIFGQIVDPQGAVVPGVTVTVTSPALQGAQTQVTDTEGRFRFPSLPPGRYSLKAELTGFKPIERENIDVGLDRTVELPPLTMAVGGVAETIQVTSPVIDVASTTIGINARAEVFNRLPIQRDIYSIARLAPGATDDGVGPAVLGSTGAENQYIIEGLNTTGMERGEKGKQLNFDFVEEIEVKTGGLPAEYGRTTGGVINVVTKSGGNTFTGSFFGFTEGGALQADEDTADLRPATTTTIAEIDSRWDFGLEGGGYILRDRLWFFGAYNRTFRRDETEVIRELTAPGSPEIGSRIPADNTTDLWAGKLTWKVSQNHTLTGSLNGDPTKREGNVFAIGGPESTWSGERTRGGTAGVLRYDGVFARDFLVRALVGRAKETDEFGGAGKTIPRFIDQTVTPTANTGGFTFHQDSEFVRGVYKVDVTKFFRSHELKGGVDFEDLDSTINRFEGGAGQRIYTLRSSAATGRQIYFRHRVFIDDRAPGFDRADPATYVPAVPLVVEPNTLNTSFYVQDSWRATSYFTVNAGVRWERQQLKDRAGETAIDLTDNWSPRIGFIWDATRNGRSKIFANYGRFYENIPMDINIRSFGGEISCFCLNFDPSPSNLIPDPSINLTTLGTRTSLLGGSATPVAEGLKGQYLDEWLVGGEYEVAPNLSLGVKFTHRDLGRVIEDFLIIDEGGYFIANPASGIGRLMTFFYDYSTVEAPTAERTNTSIELSARKKFSDNWQMLASYVWSRLEGNYDGLFQNSTGQLDPNINSAFDYADFLVNADGRLSNERVHQIKFDGSYEVATGPLNGLNIGLSTRWFSGYPLNAYGTSFGYQNWEYYLVPRGSLGRGPSEWEADLQASYAIRFGGGRRINLLVDVFNLFNRQEAIQLDERYNLFEDGACAGIPDDACNHDGGLFTTPGTLTPVFQLTNPRATATNPDFLEKGVAFTAPRSIRFGVRFNW